MNRTKELLASLFALLGVAACAQVLGIEDTALQPASTCTDGSKNGNETGVDCGGGCPRKCDVGGGCLSPSDCLSATCIDSKCVTAPTCSDNEKNGDESDKDCGGSCPTKCAESLACGRAEDCASLKCADSKCGAATCDDTIKNGDESDKDCGGSCPTKCSIGGSCVAASDCCSSGGASPDCSLKGCDNNHCACLPITKAPSGQNGKPPDPTDLPDSFLSCYGKSNPPSAENISITAISFDFTKGTSPPVALANVNVEICTSFSLGGKCASTVKGVTNDQGVAVIKLNVKQFNGYARFSSDNCPPANTNDSAGPCKPIRVFPPRPQNNNYTVTAFMITATGWDASNPVGADCRSGGDLTFTTQNCVDPPPAGIQGLFATLTPQAGQRYYLDNTGNFTQGTEVTQGPGIGAFFNVTAGSTTYALTLTPNGHKEKTVVTNLLVAEGEVSSVTITPGDIPAASQ